MMLTEKQRSTRQYYRTNRDKIIRQKKVYQAAHREEINAGMKRRRNKAMSRRCFICGGAIIEDQGSGLWQCLNPECEAEFREVM